MQSTSTKKQFLVVGATGNTGSLIAASLLSRGEITRCLVRSEEKGKALREAGAEVIVADLEKPESLAPAFEGIDSVLLITAMTPQAAEHATNGINAARHAGVSHVVRYSGALETSDFVLRSNELHQQVDAGLAASGLPFTIVRPHFFMQNLLASAPSIVSDSAIYMPFGEGRLGMVDLRDVAEAVEQIMVSGDRMGEMITITGPESVSIGDAAKAISAAVGKVVSYVDVPPKAAAEGMISSGMDQWAVDEYIAYFSAFSKGLGDFVSQDFEELMGRPPRSMAQFAQDHATAFGAERPETTVAAESTHSSAG